MSNPINPYQSPEPTQQPDLERLLSSDPLEFEFDLDRKSIATALVQTGMRPELKRYRPASAIAAGMVLLLVLMFLAQPSSLPAEIAVAIFVLLGVFCLAFYTTSFVRRRLVRAHDHIVGHYRGWVNHTGLWMEQPEQIRFRKLDALVASKSSKDWWTMTFDQTRSQFEILPRRVFSDQGTLDQVIQLLSKRTPDTSVQVMDLRRMELPTDETLFQPLDGAVSFSGKLYLNDMKGTEFSKLGSRAPMITLFPFLR